MFDYGEGPVRTAWQIQQSVIFAFFIRELKTRFGSYRLGYLWALLEPLMHMLVLLAVFGAAGRKVMPGVDFLLFVITGLQPFFFFRHISDRAADSVNANRALLAYRYVQPIDDMWARVLLESVIFVAVFLALLGISALLGHHVVPPRPLEVVLAYFLLMVFALGLGISFGVLYALFPEVQKILPMLNRPLYFVSGIFFPVAAIPLPHREWFLWNPILNAIELGRENAFPAYPPGGASWTYLSICAIFSLLFGLALYRVKRFQLLATS